MFRQWIERASAHVPSQCAVCRAWPARAVCDGCVARFAQPAPRCRTCAIRVPQGIQRCGECLLRPSPLARCLAAVDYAYPWAGIVGRFKFQEETGWATPLAMLLRSMPWAEPLLDAAHWAIPVPLADARLRERGFNQASLLAHKLARGKTRDDLLLRIRTTDVQHGLDRAARLRNLHNAFAVDPLKAGAIRGAHVVLVDDVMTTGASLGAAARALHDAGAAEVSAIVLARTPAPQ
jgi:ComF family protein